MTDQPAKQVDIYTDGACEPNPGKGGWAAILQFTDKDGKLHEKELSGNERNTTNNRMEILAVINGIKAIKYPCRLTIYSDSQYVTNAIGDWDDGFPAVAFKNVGWMVNWQEAGWRRREGQRWRELKNAELWRELYELVKNQLSVHMIWVRGHNGNVLNERCDALAVKARQGL